MNESLPIDPPEDCEQRHDYRPIPGEAPDGTRFKKCRRCGQEEEV
jgi:hypothetical protein